MFLQGTKVWNFRQVKLSNLRNRLRTCIWRHWQRKLKDRKGTAWNNENYKVTLSLEKMRLSDTNWQQPTEEKLPMHAKHIKYQINDIALQRNSRREFVNATSVYLVYKQSSHKLLARTTAQEKLNQETCN